MPEKGSVLVVGTGIRAIGQITVETENAIRDADKVLYLVQDGLTAGFLAEINPRAVSLSGLYSSGKDRKTSYREMVEQVLVAVRAGLRVCVALYGHPGVFSFPGHEVIRRARLEGFSADMIPGVSAEACLFADLGIDPGDRGCQSFEATDFLVRRRQFDSTSHLILWQVGVIGVEDFRTGDTWSSEGLKWLSGRLCDHYGPEHEVLLYEAPSYPIGGARVTRCAVNALDVSAHEVVDP
jgi:uncharacterized protein YabN with tetrapyrrole methylase and pyrophosphatase domain